MLVLLLFILELSLATCKDKSIVVYIRQGPVRGHKINGVYAFRNIPYATAPTGPDRFKAPLPAPKWLSTFNAVQRNIACPQLIENPDLHNITMTEDCLVANVFVPACNESQVPVMVYIQGGAFFSGYADMIDVSHFVQESNVVVVVFNYRLLIHGFLCLGIESAPGNAGMKDMVALLRWVRRNISRFGGNPDEVTLNGCSAGGAAVDLLMLSKMTKGLFSKAIVESGSSFSGWALAFEPVKYAQEHAELLHFDGDVVDLEMLADFFISIPYNKLNQHNYFLSYNGLLRFAPCLENDVGQEIFLDETPIDSLFSNSDYKRIPILKGVTRMEGLLHVLNFNRWKYTMNYDFSLFVPEDLRFANNDEKSQIAERIRYYYFGDQSVDESTILNFIAFNGDAAFIYPTLVNVRSHLRMGNKRIYLYEYAFTSPESVMVPFTNMYGASHCSQMVAVLDGRSEQLESREYRHMRAAMRTIYSNFIHTGQPSPPGSGLPFWPPLNHDVSPYMVIDKNFSLAGPFMAQRSQFWDEVYYSRYSKPELPPPSGTPRGGWPSGAIKSDLHDFYKYIFLLHVLFIVNKCIKYSLTTHFERLCRSSF